MEAGMAVLTLQKSEYVLEAKLKGPADGLCMRGEEEKEIKENPQDLTSATEWIKRPLTRI